MKIVANIGVILIGILSVIVEVFMLWNQPLQIFNPYFQFYVVWYLITSPVVWVIAAVTIFAAIIGHTTAKK
jgi:hypothetical protein